MWLISISPYYTKRWGTPSSIIWFLSVSTTAEHKVPPSWAVRRECLLVQLLLHRSQKFYLRYEWYLICGRGTGAEIEIGRERGIEIGKDELEFVLISDSLHYLVSLHKSRLSVGGRIALSCGEEVSQPKTRRYHLLPPSFSLSISLSLYLSFFVSHLWGSINSPVSYDDGRLCFAGLEIVYALLHNPLASRIQGRGGLIQE